MEVAIFLIIALVVGYILGWYWADRQHALVLIDKKAEFDLRFRQAAEEVQAANKDNQELRDRLVTLELEHHNCGPKYQELELKWRELQAATERAAEQDSSSAPRDDPSNGPRIDKDVHDKALAQIAELELTLRQERQRRQSLRSEFERIEQQLARAGLGAPELGGLSLSLHEAAPSFDHEQPQPAREPLAENADAEAQPQPPERPNRDGGNDVTPAGPVSGVEPPVDRAPDNLKRIKGIGPVIERKLFALGITTFAQIAELSDADVERIDAVLDFKGRIERENWIQQAAKLV